MSGSQEAIEFSAVLENIDDSFFQVDHNLKIQYLNKSALKFSDKNKEDILGTYIFKIGPFDNIADIQKRFEIVLNGKDRLEEEANLIVGSKKRWYNIIITPFKNGLNIFLHDIDKKKKTELELRKSKELYKLVSQNTGDVIWLLDLNSEHFLYVSPSVYKLRGYKNDEVLNQTMGDVLTLESYDNIKKSLIPRIEQFMAGDESLKITTHRVDQKRKDGSTVPTEVVTTLLTDDEGRVNRVVGVSRDISERIRAEEALLESERHNTSLISSLPGMAYRCENDSKWTMRFLSSQCKELTGYEPEDIIDNKKISYNELVHPEDRERIWDYIQDCIKNKKAYEIIYRIKTKDQEIKWVWERGSGIFKHKYLLFLEGFIEDITQNKIFEDKLIKSEAKNRFLLEKLPATVWTVDHKLNFSSFTGSGLSILGLKSDEVEIQSLYEFFKTNDSNYEPIAAHKQALMGNSVSYTTEFDNVTWKTHLEPFSDNKGEIVGVIGVAHDITDLKNSENRIKASLQEKELLLKEIHHRVKNNMQIISSLISLQKQYVDDNTFNVLTDSQNRINSMAMIHEKLYQSTNLNSIDFADYVQNLVYDLSSIVAYPYKIITPVLKVDDITLNIETAAPCGLIINELVSNSLKYAFQDDQEGHIYISLKASDGGYLLIVGDDGVGLPEDMDFKNTSSLGLQLVNSLVMQLNGDIKLLEGNGTTYQIFFKELKYKERF